jgi:hypothetical protein
MYEWKVKRRIGIENVRFSGTLYADSFNHIVCSSQTRRVGDNDRETLDIHGNLKDIARRTRYRSDDCGLTLRFTYCISSAHWERGRKEVVPKKLSKVLLPAFGGPKIASLMPCRIISPRLPSLRVSRIFSRSSEGRLLGCNQSA